MQLPIYRFLQGCAFEPEHIGVMTTAFEDACRELGLTERDDPLRVWWRKPLSGALKPASVMPSDFGSVLTRLFKIHACGHVDDHLSEPALRQVSVTSNQVSTIRIRISKFSDQRLLCKIRP
jgi:hypothetical protein